MKTWKVFGGAVVGLEIRNLCSSLSQSLDAFNVQADVLSLLLFSSRMDWWMIENATKPNEQVTVFSLCSCEMWKLYENHDVNT